MLSAMPRWVALVLALCACAGPQPGHDATVARDAPEPPPSIRAAVRTADITPEPGALIVGFGTRESTSVRDPLEAAVLVLRDGTRTLALVTLDLPGIFDWHASLVRTLVAARIGASYEDVVVTASHTHSAPMLGDDAWSHGVLDAIGALAGEAAAALEPVTMSYGEDRIDFDVNRRLVVDGEALARPNPDGPHDSRARVLALRAHGGATRALLTHAVCHPNLLRGVESTRISADFPGEARRALVDLGAPWLFALGSAGDVRPNIVDAEGEFRLGEDEDLVAVGGELARATRSALDHGASIAPTPIVTAHSMLALPRVDGGERTIDLSAIRLGSIVLLTIPGEPFVEIGLAIEARLAAILDGVQVLVLGYTNGYADYIVTEDAVQYGGYEVERAILAPEAARMIEDELASLAIALF